MKFFDRVRVFTPTTGLGDTITLGSAFSAAFLTLVEAGGAANDKSVVIVEDGADFGLYRVTVGASAVTINIDSVIASKIGGTAGTSKLNLSGSATVRFTVTAADFAAANITFDPTGLNLTDATNVQEAIADLDRAFVGLPFWWAGTSPPPWALERDGNTIGDALSGATARANDDTKALFTVLWTAGWLDIYDSAGVSSIFGVSAAADFAAHKRLALPDDVTGNRFLRAAGGLLAVGNVQADEFKAHTHAYGTASENISTGSGTQIKDAENSGSFATSSTGGSETRPINRAYLPCIVF